MTRILINDLPGHPFQVELARELARRDHQVTHAHCATFAGPKGDLHPRDTALEVRSITIGRSFEKYSLLKRTVHEIAYGLASLRDASRVDVVVASNMPVLSLTILSLFCRLRGVRLVVWLQDLQGGIATHILKGRAAKIGKLLGALELSAIRRADHVVVIADSFATELASKGIDPDDITTVANWATLEAVTPQPRSNTWARTHGLDDRFVFLYSGTLGLKHQPELLLELARHFVDDPDVVVAVVAQGPGRESAERVAADEGLRNMVFFDLQPFEDLPAVLASGDVLVGLLDPAMGGYSVPSKLLSYLCAGRPILASVPDENAAAQLLAESGGGRSAASVKGFLELADRLRNVADDRRSMGDAARRYAEATFDVAQKADAFAEPLGISGRPVSAIR